MVEVTVELNFIMKIMSLQYLIQINIYWKKCFIVVMKSFLNSRQCMRPKVLKKHLLRLWPSYATEPSGSINSILQNLVTKSTDDNNLNLSA